MNEQKIQPHKITKPIQLMAAWFVGLILIVSIFLAGAANIDKPEWISPLLAISSVCFVPMFVIAIFLMQTVFRKELQEDSYYADWLKRSYTAFEKFSPENLRSTALSGNGNLDHCKLDSSVPNGDLEATRCQIYQEQKGLFLVHTWRPSLTTGQVADIIIWVHQHGKGPLSEGLIEKVEYQLGPKFFNGPMVKTNTKEAFKLEVSAYGPMLCLAKIYFIDRSDPIAISRYVDFEDAPY